MNFTVKTETKESNFEFENTLVPNETSASTWSLNVKTKHFWLMNLVQLQGKRQHVSIAASFWIFW